MKYSITDLTTDITSQSDGDVVALPNQENVTSQFILATSDNVNVTSNVGMSLICLEGYGMDSINTSGTSGGNVLDGSYGSCFLTGSPVTAAMPDTFYVNSDANLLGNLWSTIVNFHAGDQLALWDFLPQQFNITWLANQGASGFQGLTGVYTTVNGHLAAVTLAGYTMADLTNGHLTMSRGTIAAVPAVSVGSAYLHIQAS